MSGQQADITQRLQALRGLNFRFATNRDTTGMIVALIGVHVHHGVIDIIAIYGEHDADATRIPDTEANILFPRTTLWRTTGSANHVIDNLLDLPTPVHAIPDTPRHNGSWIPTSPGRLTWLTTDQPNSQQSRPLMREEEVNSGQQ
jgi:hypothetical protein